MDKLVESYRNISGHINEIYARIESAEKEIARLSSDLAEDTSIRIANLEEQLVKIDEYLLKIRGFMELAKKNLDSQNVLTIEAPPGYRVNLNRLRNWAMMIDPTSSNDPYAQRVYVVSKCDEFFLEQKRGEFTHRIEMLKTRGTIGIDADVEELARLILTYKEEIKEYIRSDAVRDFADEIFKANATYLYKTAPAAYKNPSHMAKLISPGAYAAPFQAEQEDRDRLKSVLGDFFDRTGGRVLIPVELSNDREYVIAITCSPNKRKSLDRALQNLLLQIIQGAPAGKRKIQILDGNRFNTASVSYLRGLEGSFALEHIPRNPEQMTEALEKIVSSFADMDEILELYDSVSEYNAAAEASKKLPVMTLVIFGWPNSFTNRDKELLQRIMTNYERYGISLIIVSYKMGDKNFDPDRDIPEYALQNAIHLTMSNFGSTIAMPGENPQVFTWYTFSDKLSSDYLESVKSCEPPKAGIGNEYPKHYPLDNLQAYVRNYKPIELPFGIDAKNAIHSISFENENFAAYLVGASRSGKSTLLHTLITGLIRNYHPDNLELWLADFKQLEFKKYIEHRPPHVKYILLDESPELVYDLIDKLTEKMMERQRLFAQLGVERIDQVDVSALNEPLPVIFVILDEFSIMSQSIAENESYRLRLQNLLAKGAALGFKFLFSSQTFTTGVAGLTPTARAQIQQRISMKGTKDEISETLELSANIKTEQVVNWMEALPPHYALVKHRISADTLPVVNRVLVMYIPDYSERDAMIDRIGRKMVCADTYDPGEIQKFKDKDPVIVDGNSYESFDSRREDLKEWISSCAGRAEFAGDELFLNVGTPRRMEAMIPIAIAPESRENLMLLADSSELPCTGAIICSAIESFLMQGGNIHIWAYGRNRLYRIYRDVWNKYDISVGIDEICDDIRLIKEKIDAQQEGRDLIILLGMERISADFKLEGRKDGHSSAFSTTSFDINSLLASGGLVEQDENEPDLWEFLNNVPENGTAGPMAENVQAESVKKDTGAEKTIPDESGAYDATDDFNYILNQGSRLGYHLMAISNSLADFKLSGAKLDLFRHRMAFQLTRDDSWEVFGNGSAIGMPEHICRYSDTMNGYSFRPYLHQDFGWDGWSVNDQGYADDTFKQ